MTTKIIEHLDDGTSEHLWLEIESTTGDKLTVRIDAPLSGIEKKPEWRLYYRNGDDHVGQDVIVPTRP